MSASLQTDPILCLALPSWEGTYAKSTVKLMRNLSRKHHVLYVDYAYTILDVVKGLLGKKSVPVARILGLQNRLRKDTTEAVSGLWVFTPPPVLPVNWLPSGAAYRFGLRINSMILAPFIRHAMKSINMDRPILINAFLPGLGNALKGKLNEKMTVYYCYDEISEAAWCKKHGRDDEKRYMDTADAVITTSDALWEVKERQTDFCYTVKNGVDCEIFEQTVPLALASRAEKPARKTAGFVGCIDNRLDIDLVEKLAQIKTDWIFKFVGPVVDAPIADRLLKLPNVELVGPKAQHELPFVMKDFHVGLIPFRKNEFTRFIYPMKINEYMSAGLPVIMTPFAEIGEFKSAVSVADSADAFANSLDQIENHVSMNDVQLRQQFARRNSWLNRSREFDHILSYRTKQMNAA